MPNQSGVRRNNGVHTTKRTTKPTKPAMWVILYTPKEPEQKYQTW